MLRVPRVYADTSVFGGVFDEEFAEPSRAFFELVRQGRFRLVISPVVEAELQTAPAQVRALLEEVGALAEVGQETEEAVRLQQAYLGAGIVTPRSATDALHVAQATVAGCAMIVSWNFRHIVNYRLIPMYNAVNTLHQYGPIAIHSPLEVVRDEEEDI
jgi:predicted nucleic acid-binding protein